MKCAGAPWARADAAAPTVTAALRNIVNACVNLLASFYLRLANAGFISACTGPGGRQFGVRARVFENFTGGLTSSCRGRVERLSRSCQKSGLLNGAALWAAKSGDEPLQQPRRVSI